MVGLTLFILALFGSGAFAQDCLNTTMPDGTVCPSTGLQTFPDQEHCSYYWECYDGCLNHMLCPKNYLYDPVHGWCDFPEKVCCGERDCDGRACNDNCGNTGDFDCPTPVGFFEDPKDCASYWQCSDNVAVHHTCDKKNGLQLLFRASDIQCDWPDRVECGDRPVCDDNGENCHDNHVTTAAPNLCDTIPCDHGDGYYPEGHCTQCFCRCVSGAHYEICCAPGLVFNTAIEECDWPANCA